jgi:hypothetical protein
MNRTSSAPVRPVPELPEEILTVGLPRQEHSQEGYSLAFYLARLWQQRGPIGRTALWLF